MYKIAIVLLLCLVAFVVAQPTTNGLVCINNFGTNGDTSTCEACLASPGAEDGKCAWCITMSNGFRTSSCLGPAACTANNGTIVNATANCDTCTTPEPAEEAVHCEFEHNVFITSAYSICQQINNPPPANTTTTTGTSTTSTCTISQECAEAAGAFSCSYYCAACNASNYAQVGQLAKVCDSVNTNFNESCQDELANGCVNPLPASLFSNDTLTCRPLIAYTSAGGSSTTAATTATTAATTATSAASTATQAATTATTAAATATRSATTATSAAATTRVTSGAATIAVSFALLAVALLF